jgi:hypothetical protein
VDDPNTSWEADPIPSIDRVLWVRVIRHARCAGSSLDPDQWFPVSVEIGKARQEAAAAITVCTTCVVRAECLALSLRHWDIGQHGVWGGMVAGERAAWRAAGPRPCSAPARRALLADGADPDAHNPPAGRPRKRLAEHAVTPPRPP